MFNCIKDGRTISFRDDYGKVLDAIMLSLPANDPTKNILVNYGSGGAWPDTTIWSPTYIPRPGTSQYTSCKILDVKNEQNNNFFKKIFSTVNN